MFQYLHEKTGTHQIQQYVIKLRKIPAILVTRLRIVNPSIEPDFKRFLTLNKASAYHPSSHPLCYWPSNPCDILKLHEIML